MRIAHSRPGYGGAARRALGVAILLTLMIPVAARADVESVVHKGVQEIKEPQASGDITTMATPMGGKFRCSVPYAPVSAAPSGYIIGNCLNGVELHRQMKSDEYNTPVNQFWDGGKIFGSFNGCGWVGTNWSTKFAEGTFTNCNSSSIGYNLKEYAIASNDASLAQGLSCRAPESTADKCTDGTPVAIQGICYAYANYRPWVSNQTPTNYVRYYAAPYTMRWRYIARFPQYNAPSTYWAMVRDPALSSQGGPGNWLFVPLGCLKPNSNGLLPGQQMVY